MSELSHSESRRLYAWWWDSHNSPKNSKWLQDNLADIDSKVKFMIKLLEEDADSFARRAEMYYKKRPELMKLVEEFYRAYRALAERYNHATGELRHAHRTLAKAFPDHVPVELVEDSPSKTRAHNKESGTDGLLEDARGLKQEKQGYETYHDELLKLSNENQNLKDGVLKETKRSGKAECEVEFLKKALSDIQAEKEGVLFQYQRCLEELSKIKGELNNAKKDSAELNERASRAEIEVQTLKEALVELQAEKNAGESKHMEYLEKISYLESMLSRIRNHNEAQTMKDEISRLDCEREATLNQYNQCLEKISVLENLILILESEAKLLRNQAETSESEVSELKQTLADLNKEKEVTELRYKSCSETISKLERDVSSTKEEVKRLNTDVLIGNIKLKTAEEKCFQLEMSNLSLQTEAESLVKKIAEKDQLLSHKQKEMENFQRCLQDEHVRYAKVESTLQSLQDAHSQSRNDQRALTLELENVLHTLKEWEVTKLGLQDEIRLVQEEKEIKERLENEVLHHTKLSGSLQQEIMRLKEEIEGLNRSYKSLVEQVEASGLSPKCVGSSIKSLQDENLKLKEINEERSNEIEILSKKVNDMQELLDKKVVLESSQEKVRALQESCQLLHGEKATLVSEKASLVSQLQAMTNNMHKLLEKNAVLEYNLSTAKVELEGLREKSKGLKQICELLKEERSYLLSERSSLVFELENVKSKLENLEKRYTGLEEKYVGLEKAKDVVQCQVEELKISLCMEKQERTSSQLQRDGKLAGLESQIRFLKEENGWKKKENEEEFEKTLKAQFEISILHKFIKDMEEKNCSLIVECQKHVEASKLAEKLISELESESLEQQVEAELLLDEIERLRLSIYQIFSSLETGMEYQLDDKIENGQTLVENIVGAIEDMKCLISKQEDEKQLLVVENSVLLALVEQLESKGIEIELQKMAEDLAMAMNEKDNLVELNSELKSDVRKSRQRAAILEAELDSLSNNQSDLHRSYHELEEAYVQVNKDNKNLLKKFSDLKEEKYKVEQHSNAALLECLAIANESVVLRSFGEEKTLEMNRQHAINCNLVKEVSALQKKMEQQKAENLLLKDAVHKLEGDMLGMREYNIQMKEEIISNKESLLQTQGKLFDTEMKLQTAENVNLKLCSTVECLKKDIEVLMHIKENLENEIIRLREQMEEKTVREQALGSVLKEKSNEFELWEAEATVFYFDLQKSSINEVLFKNKVLELTGVCRTLENENAVKTSEIEVMKGKVCSTENEISGLKYKLYAYNPVVAALREDIMLLEHNALLHSKFKASCNKEPKTLKVDEDPNTSNSVILLEDQSLVSLQSLHMRVKAVGKLMEEMYKPASHRRSMSKSKHKSAVDEMDQVKLRCLGRDKHEHSRKTSNTPKLQRIKTKASEIKDIPLDQVTTGSLKGILKKSSGRVELLENVDERKDLAVSESLRRSFKMTDKDIESDEFSLDLEKELGVDEWDIARNSGELKTEVSDRRVLERLGSDSQKLENLQSTVQNLRSKLEANRKGSRKAKDMDFETVEEQLLEAEETVEHLIDLNGRLMKNIEECRSPDAKVSPQKKEVVKMRRRKVREQARKGSERIGRLQLELQKIQYILLKMEEEKKNRGKNKFLKSRSIILRDFFYNGRKNSGRRKKGPLCGCFKSSTSRNGSSP